MLLNELQLNTMYTCQLSGQSVMVTQITPNNATKTVAVRGTYFNTVSGRYESTQLFDNQVIAIK